MPEFSYHNSRPSAIDCYYSPTSSGILKNFQKALNGEGVVVENQTPEQLEQVAQEMLVRAQKQRDTLALEPEGDEPVITWKHTFRSQTGGYGTNYKTREFTYVAVRLGATWYVTGANAGVRLTWVELCSKKFAEELTTGDFHLCTEWTYMGDN